MRARANVEAGMDPGRGQPGFTLIRIVDTADLSAISHSTVRIQWVRAPISARSKRA